ncbi:hypothetical protein N9121_03075 [Pseudomonadales bacterium]|nr:hypothetical protein [Pseudomonadales bacterium]MDB4362797.1 hypothetical protein [Pseudomonadales bacterium]MDB4451315.1 hypothetical protein [Pseudomonadales bacterium]
MAKKSTSSESKIIELTRDMFYASLGVQKVAYEFGVDKYSEFSKQRKKDMKNYIKRGEELESQLKDLYVEFKAADTRVAKGVVTVEQQVDKVAKLVTDLSDKVVGVAGKKAPVRKKTVARKGRAPAKRAPAKKEEVSKAA